LPQHPPRRNAGRRAPRALRRGARCGTWRGAAGSGRPPPARVGRHDDPKWKPPRKKADLTRMLKRRASARRLRGSIHFESLRLLPSPFHRLRARSGRLPPLQDMWHFRGQRTCKDVGPRPCHCRG
jgi:hypothetical protein